MQRNPDADYSGRAASRIGSCSHGFPSTLPKSSPLEPALQAEEHAPLFIPNMIRTSHGPRWLPLPAMVRVSLTPAELQTLARAIEREAREAEAAGQLDVAARLDWRGAALREAAR